MYGYTTRTSTPISGYLKVSNICLLKPFTKLRSKHYQKQHIRSRHSVLQLNSQQEQTSSRVCIMLLVLTLCPKGFTIHYVGKYYRKTMKKHIKGALSWLSCFFHKVNYKSLSEGPQYVFRDTGIPLFEARVRDFKAKSRRHSELKVYAGGGLPKITRGITRLQEDLGRDYGIEETHWGHSYSL